MNSNQYKAAEKRINDAYDNPKSPHYRNNKRFSQAVNSLLESFNKDPESIECDFCTFRGNKSELLNNGHCPKCQSPSTKTFL